MLYAMLRNPSFTSALLIPMDLRMRFPARCVMAPNICSILERVLALVRFPCFSHEVNGCPYYPPPAEKANPEGEDIPENFRHSAGRGIRF